MSFIESFFVVYVKNSVGEVTSVRVHVAYAYNKILLILLTPSVLYRRASIGVWIKNIEKKKKIGDFSVPFLFSYASVP